MTFPQGKIMHPRLRWPALSSDATSESGDVNPARGSNRQERASLDWYLKRYPDVAEAGVSPLTHYMERGAAAGYDPHPMFSFAWYLDRYPDIASAGMNPLVHYAAHGGFEGSIRYLRLFGISSTIQKLRQQVPIRFSTILNMASWPAISPVPYFRVLTIGKWITAPLSQCEQHTIGKFTAPCRRRRLQKGLSEDYWR